MNNNFGKKYEISQSSVDQKYRVYEWMTLSDITNEEERDKLKKKGRKEDIADSIVEGILEYLK